MCDPVTLAVAAVGIAAATAGVSVVQQRETAKVQARAINATNVERQSEIDKATTAQIDSRLREARRERGRIDVAAGEAGLSLQSGNVETMLMDTYQQANLSNSNSLANRESQRNASQAEANSAMSNVAEPTLLGAGLQIGLAAGSKAVGQYQRMNPN